MIKKEIKGILENQSGGKTKETINDKKYVFYKLKNYLKYKNVGTKEKPYYQVENSYPLEVGISGEDIIILINGEKVEKSISQLLTLIDIYSIDQPIGKLDKSIFDEILHEIPVLVYGGIGLSNDTYFLI